MNIINHFFRKDSYPPVVDESKVGTYTGLYHSGAGYFYDEVLEYRVWSHPEMGALDTFAGEDYFHAFSNYEQALYFSRSRLGTEKPIVLVLQKEWIDEPEPGIFIHKKKPRITEWRVEWLKNNKRTTDSIKNFLSNKK